MDKPVDRPPSVWITQIVLILPVVTWVVKLLTLLFLRPPAEQPVSSLQPFQPLPLPLEIALWARAFIMFAPLFFIFWGLQKRKRYGKWLAAILLIGGAVSVISESRSLQLVYRSLTQWHPLPAPPYECWESGALLGNTRILCGYSSYRELALKIIVDLLPALLLGFLSVRLLFGRAAKRFFR